MDTYVSNVIDSRAQSRNTIPVEVRKALISAHRELSQVLVGTAPILPPFVGLALTKFLNFGHVLCDNPDLGSLDPTIKDYIDKYISEGGALTIGHALRDLSKVLAQAAGTDRLTAELNNLIRD